MKNMPIKLMFLTLMMLSTMMSITANSWLGAWMGLEINMMSLIPLISSQESLNHNLSSIKYFLTQTIASITLISSFLIYMMYMFNMNIYIINMMALSMLMKIGAAPLHFWYPEVMKYLSWNNCMLIMTWQKIAPFSLLSYIQTNQMFMVTFIFSSAFIGSIMGLNQISLRLMMAYSSITHISWMLASIQSSFMTWMYYVMVYSLMTVLISLSFKANNLNTINELFLTNNDNKINKFNMMISILSLAGMPPFLGFLPKWLLLYELMNNSLFLTSSILIISSMITLYFYMKLFLSASLILIKECKWNTLNYKLTKLMMITLYLNTISTMSLMISPLFFK